jgi:hypothetical protein
MAHMGSYCRAYYARDFAAFPGWRPDLAQLCPGMGEVDGRAIEIQREGLGDEDILYLQENFGVTDGLFLDENVVFADAGPEWRAFCSGELGFAPPATEPESAEPVASES